MKKLKTQKGITLIALIITIVVLLILAVVAIGAAQDSNIVGYAQNAAGKYEEGKGIENNTISDMESLLEQYANGVVPGGNGGGVGNNPPATDDPEITPEPPVDTTLSVGKTIYYDSNNDNQKEEWIVYSMTDENNFEIISANTMGSLTLGYNDPYLPTSVGDLNGNGTGDEDFDKAIWSYNHVIATINSYCQSLITSTDHSGVRSIGATAAQDTAGLDHWNVLKGSDTYGEEAITYLNSINCLTSKNSNNYWIASRVQKTGGGYNFAIYQYGISGDLGNYYNNSDNVNLAEIAYVGLGGIPNDSAQGGRDRTAGVRPIISNPVNYSFTNN